MRGILAAIITFCLIVTAIAARVEKSTVVQCQQQGKQKPIITAYKNGKKLSEKQAEKLYKLWQGKQQKMQSAFVIDQAAFDKMMQNQMNAMSKMMQNIKAMMPTIIIINNTPAPKTTAEKQAVKANQQFHQTTTDLFSGTSAIKNLHQKEQGNEH